MNIFLLSLLLLLWALVVYHHVGYPLLLALIRKAYNQAITQPPLTDEKELPHIVMLVPAYNEAAVIADKIRNTAILDYPATRLHLLIACDGCTDDTAQIALNTAAEPEIAHLKVKVLEFKRNQGKVAMLNKIIPRLKSDLIALSDASALLSVDGLKLAAGHFITPDTGIVAATYKLLNPASVGEAKYWQYQTRILQTESQLGSPIGVHGALYFMRRTLFRSLPADTINDDFVLPMSVVAEGYRAIYEPNITALELEQASNAMDQQRRIRISAGNLQQVFRLKKLLNPKRGGIAFAFFSGKGLRGAMPLILLLQLILCGWLALQSVSFLAIFIIQACVITLAAFSTRQTNLPSPIGTLFYLVNGYRSGLTGSIRYLLGMERGCWKSISSEEVNS